MPILEHRALEHHRNQANGEPSAQPLGVELDLEEMLREPSTGDSEEGKTNKGNLEQPVAVRRGGYRTTQDKGGRNCWPPEPTWWRPVSWRHAARSHLRPPSWLMSKRQGPRFREGTNKGTLQARSS